ncbi:hypothetical protein QJS66_14050 [Kocuria rhizophila]|nr:hypothetical protein QJS66_14050 [Kocuria rhizophila]
MILASIPDTVASDLQRVGALAPDRQLPGSWPSRPRGKGRRSSNRS